MPSKSRPEAVRLRAGVVGATGYAGQDLLRILANHPRVEITSVTASKARPGTVSDLFPSIRTLPAGLACEKFSAAAVARDCDVVFLSLPHSVSMQYAPELLRHGTRVIDLSADYRFIKADVYEKWYAKHTDKENLKNAVYGLPERYRSRIRKARLVAGPGCYPSSVILSCAPLLESGLVEGPVIANCLSGISGAGKNLNENFMFCQARDNAHAYKAGGKHRHTPEMEQELSRAAGRTVPVSFIPHTIPVSRGILATCALQNSGKATDTTVLAVLEKAYRTEPFIRVLPAGVMPELVNVKGTNYVDIGVALDQRTGLVVVGCALDNLVKGASGAAVQCMNVMFGLTETAGLDASALHP